ncbi:domain of unknown function DUF1745 [Methanothermus fervidus DSM 2088]|uniref:FIST C domain protein n=1 Tax=Methanothermus fervidus (strain ATCC 43054 / DSM 2088 / JCM 10308 / V24 S) TaxID=523846 RepID=E3GWE3_METFV|nr:FIST N-terminal domain-containing protein [Methanothermus fervidus]ADP77908.1 domain of unknown function DUF1745 [Methanothermus fervidus DSM 2088]
MGNVLKVGVGQDKNPKKAVDMALNNVENPDLTLVFASSNLNMEKIYETIKDEVGDSCVVGGSTAGEFSSVVKEPKENTVAVMTIESPYLGVGVGIGEKISEDPFKCGRTAVRDAYSSFKGKGTLSSLMSVAFMSKRASEISKLKPFVNIVIPDGLCGKEEEFLRGVVYESESTTPIIGGSTGDNLKFEKTFQICNGLYSNAGVVTVLGTVLKIGCGYGHPYTPTNKTAVVTKSEGRVLYELNHKPADEVIKEFLNVDELTYEMFSTKTFGVKSSDVFGEYTIKAPAKINDDGSIMFYSEVKEGSLLTLMETNKENAINSFKNTLKAAIHDAGNPENIGCIIIFNCVLKYLLNKKLGINDLEIIREMLGDVPVIGFNTYGEQGATLGGSIGHYNQTSTLMVIGDEVITQ